MSRDASRCASGELAGLSCRKRRAYRHLCARNFETSALGYLRLEGVSPPIYALREGHRAQTITFKSKVE